MKGNDEEKESKGEGGRARLSLRLRPPPPLPFSYLLVLQHGRADVKGALEGPDLFGHVPVLALVVAEREGKKKVRGKPLRASAADARPRRETALGKGVPAGCLPVDRQGARPAAGQPDRWSGLRACGAGRGAAAGGRQGGRRGQTPRRLRPHAEERGSLPSPTAARGARGNACSLPARVSAPDHSALLQAQARPLRRRSMPHATRNAFSTLRRVRFSFSTSNALSLSLTATAGRPPGPHPPWLAVP